MRMQMAREFALSLPEVTEAPHFDKSSFRVGKKIFATVPQAGTHLHILIDAEQAQAMVAAYPEALEELWWGKQIAGVRVELAKAPEEVVVTLLEEAWCRRAPKKLVEKLDESLSQTDRSLRLTHD